MRKMFVVAAALLVTFTGLSTTRADNRPQTAGGYTSGATASGNSARSYRNYRGNVFDRLLEMERRKNAWIFGGFRR